MTLPVHSQKRAVEQIAANAYAILTITLVKETVATRIVLPNFLIDQHSEIINLSSN